MLFKTIAKKALFALTLWWKNKKQPSGPIELDLEAGNLVLVYLYIYSFIESINIERKQHFLHLFPLQWEIQFPLSFKVLHQQV